MIVSSSRDFCDGLLALLAMSDLEKAADPQPPEGAPLYGDRSRALGLLRTVVSFVAVP